MIAMLLRLLGKWALRHERKRVVHAWDFESRPVSCVQCGEAFNRLNFDEECDGD